MTIEKLLTELAGIIAYQSQLKRPYISDNTLHRLSTVDFTNAIEMS